MRIAIIGGGPSGLFAAWQLTNRLPNCRVTIFEAEDRIGGKVQTKYFASGLLPYEMGVAELYDYSQVSENGSDPMKELIQSLGLQILPMYEVGWTRDSALREMLSDDSQSDGLPVVIDGNVMRNNDDVRKYLGDEAADQIEAFHEKVRDLYSKKDYADWRIQNDHPWAQQDFRSILEQEVPNLDARKYIEVAVHSDLAHESYRTNGLNAIKNLLMDHPDYMRLYYIQGGLEQFPQQLAEKLQRTGRVALETGRRVSAISQVAGGYKVDWIETGGDNFEQFDAVVLALPNHWYPSIEFDPPYLAEAMHDHWTRYDNLAHYLRVSICFREPFWRSLIPGFYSMLDAFGGTCLYDEDARQHQEGLTENAFCPTGEGGGIDPHCSPRGSKKAKDAGKRPKKPESFLSDEEIASHGKDMVASHEADPHCQAVVRELQKAQESHRASQDAVSKALWEFNRDGKHENIKEVMNTSSRTAERLREAETAYQHESRRSMLLSFGLKKKDRGNINGATSQASETAARDWKEAEEYLQQISGDVIGNQLVSIRGSDSRPYYLHGTIYTSSVGGPAISAHEFGHHLENMKYAQERVQSFRNSRFNPNEDVPMTVVAPNHGYDNNEIGNQDKMLDTFKGDKSQAAYCGKKYSSQSTEILSMGLELLYNDPVHFAKTDPQYFGLIVGILQRGDK